VLATLEPQQLPWLHACVIPLLQLLPLGDRGRRADAGRIAEDGRGSIWLASSSSEEMASTSGSPGAMHSAAVCELRDALPEVLTPDGSREARPPAASGLPGGPGAWKGGEHSEGIDGERENEPPPAAEEMECVGEHSCEPSIRIEEILPALLPGRKIEPW